LHRKAYTELLIAIHNKKNEAMLKSMLAKQLTFSTLSIWEAFISDLLIAYVAANPGKMVEDLKDRVEQSILSKFGSEPAKTMKLNIKFPLSRTRVAAILDPKGFNVTLKTSKQLTERANQILPARFAKKFSLHAPEAEFYDFAIALRNYLAHGSTSSRSYLKETISSLSRDENKMFKDSITDIGMYLKEIVSSKKTRAILLSERLEKLAKKIS